MCQASLETIVRAATGLRSDGPAYQRALGAAQGAVEGHKASKPTVAPDCICKGLKSKARRSVYAEVLKSLRARGLTYSEIATETGLTRKAVAARFGAINKATEGQSKHKRKRRRRSRNKAPAQDKVAILPPSVPLPDYASMPEPSPSQVEAVFGASLGDEAPSLHTNGHKSPLRASEALVRSVKHLYSRGMSLDHIARELGVTRDEAGNALREASAAEDANYAEQERQERQAKQVAERRASGLKNSPTHRKQNITFSDKQRKREGKGVWADA